MLEAMLAVDKKLTRRALKQGFRTRENLLHGSVI
jgi:hypothetical protein